MMMAGNYSHGDQDKQKSTNRERKRRVKLNKNEWDNEKNGKGVISDINYKES